MMLLLWGGPAGCAAAISAARRGSKVLLVEQYGFLGGMGTVALITFPHFLYL
ncbi:FAD-dependent oxidoreductase [Blautia sp. JLR.GB0024]|uniref:FAD-dependent oxidoreductase n=1 Tax=Blautia sp. JLR.GB0024 TaxID=3123295 RepID=UPI003FA5313D